MPETRILTRHEVEMLLDPRTCVEAVERAFRARAEGGRAESAILGLRTAGGGFHAKAALMDVEWRPYFAAKLNANFPDNPTSHKLPTIQGVLALFDASDGRVLAVMDSIGLTILRTAAATGVAARHLSREDASRVTIVGCGAQALAQITALAVVRPITQVFAVDRDAHIAEAFARTASDRLGLSVSPSRDLMSVARRSDIIVTCTTAKTPFLGGDHVAPGAFIAAVGADSEDKSEIDPALMAVGAVVTDSTTQCASIGDLHHAIDAGTMGESDVRAELGDVIVDPARGRRGDDEIVIFDSTGVAIQDVAAAAIVYERATIDALGLSISLGD